MVYSTKQKSSELWSLLNILSLRLPKRLVSTKRSSNFIIEHNIIDQHLIVHGDAQSNNMLFYLNEDCSPSNKIAAWIDWQTLYEGNPLLDLSRFLTFCTDATVRRAVDKQCIDLYYNTLTELLTKSGITIPFTRDEVSHFFTITKELM